MRHAFSGRRAARRPAHYAVLALVAGVLSLLPSAAHAGWSRPPDTLSGDVSIYRRPITLIDGRGTTYLVTSGPEFGSSQSPITVRTRPAGGRWGAATTLADFPGAALEDAAVAPDGTLVVLWSYPVDAGTPYEDSYSVASTRSPRGAWSSHYFTGWYGRLLINKRGDALAYAGGGFSFRPAGAGWGPGETVQVPTRNFNALSAGIDGHGNVTFTFTKGVDRCYPTVPCPVFTVERRRDGQWANPTRTPAQYNNDSHGGTWFAESDSGAAILTWSLLGTVRSTVRPAGTTGWGPGHTFGQTANGLVPTATGSGGRSSLVWLGTDKEVHLAEHRPGHGWQQRTLGTWTASPYNDHPDYPSLVAAPDGSMVAGWRGSTRAMMAIRSPGAGWGRPIAVPMGDLAVGDGGVVASTWAPRQPGNPFSGTVVTSGYEPGHASFGSVKVARAGRVGQPLSYAATVGSWLPATITWHFGDGHLATGNHVDHRYRHPGTYYLRVTIKDTSGSTRTAHRTVTITR